MLSFFLKLICLPSKIVPKVPYLELTLSKLPQKFQVRNCNIFIIFVLHNKLNSNTQYVLNIIENSSKVFTFSFIIHDNPKSIVPA